MMVTSTDGAVQGASAVKPRVGVIGLGIMGGAIARNLAAAGFAVAGFDADPARLTALGRAGIRPCGSAAEVASHADVLLSSLPSDAALDASIDAILAWRGAAATTGHVSAGADATGASPPAPMPAPAFTPTPKPASTLAPTSPPASAPAPASTLARVPEPARRLDWLELSTLSIPAKTRARERLAAAGVALLDAPISGTGAQAETRDLVVYVSGDAAAARRCAAVLDGFARAHAHVGAFGHGMRLKLVANLLVAIHNVATAEALGLAARVGLDPAQALELLGGGAAASRILALRGPLMVRDQYQPATMKLDLWQKDLALIAALARDHDAATPLFDATLPIYDAAVQAGLGPQDTAAVFRILKEMSRDAAT